MEQDRNGRSTAPPRLYRDIGRTPENISEWAARREIEPTVREACQHTEARRAREERKAQKIRLVQQGLAEVSSCLLELKSRGEISSDEYWDSDFTADLRDHVKSELEAELSADETIKEVRDLVREIIDNELG